MAYNYKIVIEQMSTSRGDYGGVSPTWSTYKTVWADVEDVTSGEDFESDMTVFEDGKSFKIHTHDAPNVTPKMRISYDSQYYDIRSIRKEGRLRTVLVGKAFDDE